MSCLYAKGDAKDIVERPVSGHRVHGREGYPYSEARQLRDCERQVYLSDERKVKFGTVSLGILEETKMATRTDACHGTRV